MVELIKEPTTVAAAGNIPKVIEEYVGRVNAGTGSVSIAHMRSPGGWQEPGQRPDFDEYTIVLAGELHVQDESGTTVVSAGQAVHSSAGEWVRYGSPGAAGADYIAVCVPAFAPDTVHHDE
jgi:mannose-6-phosphate isomerase-like protein (cupin superfamily)